jgi:aarF domain-containing kinase
MIPQLKELIEALPRDDDAAGKTIEISEQRLREIFDDLANRPVPVGSVRRLWTLSDLSVQIALAYMAFWVRQWFVDAETRKQRLVETNLRVALKLIHRMGYLRGAVAKVGQLLGGLPEVLPDQVVSTLDKLHFEAPPMHFSLLREMVRNELGKDPEEIFETFDKRAFAAASLGQVHRATLKTGEKVAVKIQYPGIARTIDADMRNLAALMFPERLGRNWTSIKAQFDAIQRMLKSEVDYRHEAENLRRARALFNPEDGIVIPRLHEDYSTGRVLTTDFVSGQHLDAFLAAKPPQAVRNAFGTKLFTVWYRMYYAAMHYADPHAGNYLFMRDGRLGLLDFGCIQHFDTEERELVRLAEQFFTGDLSGLPEFLRRARVPEKNIADPGSMRRSEDMCNWMLEPARKPGPFDYGDGSHLKRGVELISQTVLKRENQVHPMYTYYYRSILGLKALLYRLGAQVDVREIHDREVQALHL